MSVWVNYVSQSFLSCFSHHHIFLHMNQKSRESRNVSYPQYCKTEDQIEKNNCIYKKKTYVGDLRDMFMI